MDKEEQRPSISLQKLGLKQLCLECDNHGKTEWVRESVTRPFSVLYTGTLHNSRQGQGIDQWDEITNCFSFVYKKVLNIKYK